VRFGPKCPDGFLPVFSTDTKEEAKRLLTLCCDTNLDGEFVARELVMKRDFDSLHAFSDRLQKGWDFLMAADKKKKKPKPLSAGIAPKTSARSTDNSVESRKKAVAAKSALSAIVVVDSIKTYIDAACAKLEAKHYDLVLEELAGYIEVCQEARKDDRRRNG
jgi:hypothetical protein